MSVPTVTSDHIAPITQDNLESCNNVPPLRQSPSASNTLSGCSDRSISSVMDLSNRFTNNNNHFKPVLVPGLPSMSNVIQILHSQNTVFYTHPVKPIHKSSTPDLRVRPGIAKGRSKSTHDGTKPSHTSQPHSTHIKLSLTGKLRTSKYNIPGESRYWTISEHKMFFEALVKYGPKEFKAISAYVRTRSVIQCRTHEVKLFRRLLREAQARTILRNDRDGSATYGSISAKDDDEKPIWQRDVYSVPSSCGIMLLCVVGEEMERALQS